MRKWFLMLSLLLLVACGGDDTAPVNQVKALVAATEARNVDQMVALIVPESRRDARWQLNQVMPSVTSLKYPQPPAIILDKIEGDRAYVQVSGTMVATLADGRTVETPVSQLIELVKQDNTWYITASGFELPPAPEK